MATAGAMQSAAAAIISVLWHAEFFLDNMSHSIRV
jgi:hypothetical protein